LISKGFALLELLIVMAVMAIFLAIGTLSWANLERDSSLSWLAAQVKTALYQAQAQTINGLPSGVYFEPQRFVAFQGASFVEGDPHNLATTLPEGTIMTDINLVNQSVTFDRVTGDTQNFSPPVDLTLLESGTGKTIVISLNRLGIVEQQ